MRFELRPHRHCQEFPYDGGWAVWDTQQRRPAGWYADKPRAAARVAERNRAAGAEVPAVAGVAAAEAAERSSGIAAEKTAERNGA